MIRSCSWHTGRYNIEVIEVRLNDKLIEDMKDAMRAKDRVRLATIRLVRSALTNLEKDKKAALTDEVVIEVIGREAKKRREAAEQFGKAGRDELAAREKAELAILEGYLPEQLSRDEIVAIVRPILDALPMKSPSQMGQVMGKVMPKVKGKADGKLVNEIVREELAK